MPRSLSERSKSLLVVLYYVALGVFITWPVVLHLGQAVVGSIGDNIYFIWLIRWYQRAIFELHIPPLFNPWMNYPEGWNLSTTDTAFSTTLPGVAFGTGGCVLGLVPAITISPDGLIPQEAPTISAMFLTAWDIVIFCIFTESVYSCR